MAHHSTPYLCNTVPCHAISSPCHTKPYHTDNISVFFFLLVYYEGLIFRETGTVGRVGIFFLIFLRRWRWWNCNTNFVDYQRPYSHRVLQRNLLHGSANLTNRTERFCTLVGSHSRARNRGACVVHRCFCISATHPPTQL